MSFTSPTPNPVRFSAYYESLWDSIPLLKDIVCIVCYTLEYNLIWVVLLVKPDCDGIFGQLFYYLYFCKNGRDLDSSLRTEL